MLAFSVAEDGAHELAHEGVLPPTINYDTPDPECDLDYIPTKPAKPPSRSPFPTHSASADTTPASYYAASTDKAESNPDVADEPDHDKA